eukprot:TRINITY_DN67636_c0_g1_i1.p1 TRINITY_DN67636_c0_g1~~TRINITY_DN67636_c0_g1_i1.p1  ORF type:complete len:992 (+),score=166.59 TRINITY_DN67636_c0_g1_i1:88-3063(+)
MTADTGGQMQWQSCSAHPAQRTNSIISLASVKSAVSVASVASFTVGYQQELRMKDKSGGFAAKVARMVLRNPYHVICAWAVIFIVSVFLAPRLLDMVQTSYDPEPSMPSGQARAALDRHFAQSLQQSTESVLFKLDAAKQAWETAPVLTSAARAVDAVVVALNLEQPDVIAGTRSWRERSSQQLGVYVSKDKLSWVMQVVWSSENNAVKDARADAVAAKLVQAVRGLNETFAPQGVELVATGSHTLRRVSQDVARHDVGWHAIMFLPIAILLMNLFLWRVVLLPLPALCSLVALAFSFALGLVAASLRKMDANAPTLMAFVSVSLCIDWCFFLLARFNEESSRGQMHVDAVLTALVRTGATILLSGVLIVACSGCMMTMPTAIASTALGGIITVVASLLCCLTLLPACLAAWPRCFARAEAEVAAVPASRSTSRQHDGSGGGAGSGRGDVAGVGDEEHVHGVRARHGTTHSMIGQSDGDDDGVAFLSHAHMYATTLTDWGQKVHQCQHTCWYAWAVVVTTFPLNIVVIVVVCGLFVPATLALTNYRPAVSEAMTMPLGDPAVMAQQQLIREFTNPMSRSQMFILAEAVDDCSDGITSNGYFNATCDMAQRLVGVGKQGQSIQASYVLGASLYSKADTDRFTCLPWRRDFATLEEGRDAITDDLGVSAHFLLTGTIGDANLIPSDEFIELHMVYQQLWNKCVSSDRRASLLIINLPYDAASWDSLNLLEELREVLAKGIAGGGVDPANPCTKLTTHEISASSVLYDNLVASVNTLPMTILIACVVTTPVIALSFWSFAVPLKLLLTVILPLTWVYGVAVMCFQDGLLDAIPMASPFHSSEGLFWMVPSCTCMLLLALALDYNVFYFGRVVEFRKAGLTDLEALRQGLASTGPVITCAGTIFAVEFSGLFFSSTTVNKQGGFVVVVGILLDTFVVRSCLTPAVLSLWPSANWWPSKMPKPKDVDAQLDPTFGRIEWGDSDNDGAGVHLDDLKS